MKPVNSQQAADCDDFDPNSLPVEKALERIASAVTPIKSTQRVALRDALGRVLASDVIAPFDIPEYANSAMDGYALAFSDLDQAGGGEFEIVGASWAGKPFADAVTAGQCVRIFTGAVLPVGVDTIVMQENVSVSEEKIAVVSGQRLGQHVRPAGGGLKKKMTALKSGTKLSPADLGVVASLGFGELEVFERPRVAFFSTGDELRSIGEALGIGDVYDSNRYVLHGMLTRLGVTFVDLGVVHDDFGATKSVLLEASKNADAVISSAGASVGDADFIKQALDELGEVNFWKIAMKPGRPLSFGKINDAIFFGLPGNPVSVVVTFYQFVRPALLRLMGATETEAVRVQVPLACDIKKQPGRLEFQRGILRKDAMGQLEVVTTGAQDSHILSSMSRANCFIVLPMEQGNVASGELVTVEPFEGIV